MTNIKVYNVEDDDSKTAQPAWVAFEDEKEKSKENKPLYNDKEISEGEALLSKVQGIFPMCKAHLNIRQKFLAVKVGPITIRERITPQYKEMLNNIDKDYDEVVIRGKSLIFRIKRKVV